MFSLYHATSNSSCIDMPFDSSLTRPISLILILILIGGGFLPVATGDWNQFRGDNENGGSLSSVGRPTSEMIWKFGTESGIESSPAVVKGNVYITSKDGIIYCLDSATGVERWRYRTNGKITSACR